MINPDQFLNLQTEEAHSTEFTPVPEGDYDARIPEGGVRFGREYTNKQGERQAILDLYWEILESDPNYATAVEETGMEKPRVKQSLFLDVTFDSSGNVIGIATGKGKNVGLGRLRTALGQNKEGRKWSPKHLEGAAGRIKVEHTITDGGTYAQVARDGVVGN